MQHNNYKIKLNQLILLNSKNNSRQNALNLTFIKYKFNLNKYLYLIISNFIYIFFKFYLVLNFSKKFNYYLNSFYYYY